MTTWGAQAPPLATTSESLWSPLDDSFPPMLDGGNARTLLWLGLYDGGDAAHSGADIAIGIGPQRTVWNPHAHRSTAWVTVGAP
jgi:hypothetical protein